MSAKPKCVIVTGRPGAGKTTLAAVLSRRLHLPKISRDELKEGYVNAFGVGHGRLPLETNGIVTDIFFDTVMRLLKNDVSLVAEAAFQHRVWARAIPRMCEIADVCMVICDAGAELSARRHIERGLADPSREFYHGDKTVARFAETGALESASTYATPEFDLPTMTVSTVDGYDPALEEIAAFVGLPCR